MIILVLSYHSAPFYIIYLYVEVYVCVLFCSRLRSK